MPDFIESVGLHSQGFNDEQIAEIDAVKDDVAHVISMLQAIFPHIEKVLANSDDFFHIAATIQGELPRIKRILPVVKMATQVIAQHQKEQI